MYRKQQAGHGLTRTDTDEHGRTRTTGTPFCLLAANRKSDDSLIDPLLWDQSHRTEETGRGNLLRGNLTVSAPADPVTLFEFRIIGRGGSDNVMDPQIGDADRQLIHSLLKSSRAIESTRSFPGVADLGTVELDFGRVVDLTEIDEPAETGLEERRTESWWNNLPNR